ncbi:MAG: tetraacyldisaccharide 4'-kinase [Bacteroidales bacterium]|nr:tetraacyldisaccharide 4'-kinase [Bacteroidales bacterium]
MTLKNLKIFLLIFALPYGLAIRIRNFLFNVGVLKSRKFKVPVISVGNLSVGGTGKTPHIEYLVTELKKDFKVAVLSRGYKRKTRGYILATNNSTALEIGDESAQIKLKFPDIIVAVDADRVGGIKRLCKDIPDIDVILLDDAFQHRYVEAGISILLSDYNKPFFKDYLLPAGRLREHRYNSKRADYILITRSPINMSAIERRVMVGEIDLGSHQTLYFTSVIYKEPYPLFDKSAEPVCLSEIVETKRNILLVTGIADPSHLYNYLSIYSEKIIHLSYPDHHFYNEKDIQKIIDEYQKLPKGKRCIITSEKDAERLKEKHDLASFPKESTFVQPIGTTFLNNDSEEFNKFISDYVRKTKSNSSIS